MRFGSSTPELQKFVVRVLNLTCSALGCERNWSTFESVISLFCKFIFIYFYSNIREFPFHINTSIYLFYYLYIHTKKRNRLEHKRLNALVYVRYNTRAGYFPPPLCR